MDGRGFATRFSHPDFRNETNLVAKSSGFIDHDRTFEEDVSGIRNGAGQMFGFVRTKKFLISEKKLLKDTIERE